MGHIGALLLKMLKVVPELDLDSTRNTKVLIFPQKYIKFINFKSLRYFTSTSLIRTYYILTHDEPCVNVNMPGAAAEKLLSPHFRYQSLSPDRVL